MAQSCSVQFIGLHLINQVSVYFEASCQVTLKVKTGSFIFCEAHFDCHQNANNI